jgi:hypothetical protein
MSDIIEWPCDSLWAQKMAAMLPQYQLPTADAAADIIIEQAAEIERLRVALSVVTKTREKRRG